MDFALIHTEISLVSSPVMTISLAYTIRGIMPKKNWIWLDMVKTHVDNDFIIFLRPQMTAKAAICRDSGVALPYLVFGLKK